MTTTDSIVAWLRDRPGQAFSPKQITQALGVISEWTVRSTLKRLVGRGEVARDGYAQYRYAAGPVAPKATTPIGVQLLRLADELDGQVRKLAKRRPLDTEPEAAVIDAFVGLSAALRKVATT